MSDLGKIPVYPVECTLTDSGELMGVQTGNRQAFHTGITLRQHYAGIALQGILANRVYDPPRRNKLDKMAEDAVAAADALIAALPQSQTAKE